MKKNKEKAIVPLREPLIQRHLKPKPVKSMQEEALRKCRAILGEAFEDFVVVARTRNPSSIQWAFSDASWAKGAMQNILGDI